MIFFSIFLTNMHLILSATCWQLRMQWRHLGYSYGHSL